jgi:hypothetical protein
MTSVVSIFVHKNLKFTKINLEDYYKDQDLEVCALKLDPTFSNICILTLYRAPSGNFDHFLNRLETILNVPHSPELLTFPQEFRIILDQR